MDETVEQAVQRAITTMHDRLGEPVTLDDMAKAAMFSKFHFTRVFQRVTGLSPGRFLSAIRLQRAKQLLVSTDLNVADISFLVGFNSVGTFSSRFSRSVGMSPSQYRKQGGFATHLPAPAPPESTESALDTSASLVEGVVRAHEERGGPVFVGLFPGRLPEGTPVRSTLLERPGYYQLHRVPKGSWYVHAHRLAQDVPNPSRAVAAAGPEPMMVGSRGPIVTGRGGNQTVRKVDVLLNSARIMDPPVLLAVPDARTLASRLGTRDVG
ncbi:helix-turn-helix domain-containing protein [Streptomyces sp. HUAS ZL42]|uniref:helix-turn-helix domain-containing protein n=1 Tax=Streptomyces sp. HUAS ZL42 TaxID=3231715 RepID=UPI00345E8E18